MNLVKIGRYRLDFHRPHPRRVALRKGGWLTQWPWRELAVPGIGSLILGRTRPREVPDGEVSGG